MTPEQYKKLTKPKGHSYRALGRMKAGKMNRLEERYAAHLETLKSIGKVLWYAFEPCNLRLGDKCFYSIDFLVLTDTNELQAHECKGSYITDDALVKLKTAAEKFPFPFIMVKWEKSAWTYKEY